MLLIYEIIPTYFSFFFFLFFVILMFFFLLLHFVQPNCFVATFMRIKLLNIYNSIKEIHGIRFIYTFRWFNYKNDLFLFILTLHRGDGDGGGVQCKNSSSLGKASYAINTTTTAVRQSLL